jgi:PhnB protein
VTSKLVTYLNYGGNCEAAFRFYEEHLGGRIEFVLRRSDMPAPSVTWPGWQQSIQFARMLIGGTELFASDVAPERFKPMRSAYLSFDVDSVEEAERIWALLADGGEVFMPMAETFWAARYGALRDRFGTSWMIQHSGPPRS